MRVERVRRYLADPDGRGGTGEARHTGLEGCHLREGATAARVDGADTELVGLPWEQVHPLRLVSFCSLTGKGRSR